MQAGACAQTNEDRKRSKRISETPLRAEGDRRALGMANLDTDVFVVGGGPAGLAAAIAARRHGFRVVVADLLRPPIDKACGEGLMPDSQAELARLGVSVTDLPQGSFKGIRFVGPRDSVEAEFPHGRGVGVRRTVLLAALIEHAEATGVELRWGVRVSGLRDGAVLADGRVVRCRWVVGADGQNSQVRTWAGLSDGRVFERRMALRRHFVSDDLPEFVEIHWGEHSQAYLTPISRNEMCVAIICKNKLGAFETEMEKLPTLQRRLKGAHPSSAVRGAVTVSSKLRRVYRDRTVLVGEASGSVDAITGEGLALGFRQALSLGRALAENDLSLYEAEHRQIEALPQFMRRAMLLMDKSSMIRKRTLRALQAEPGLFERMLRVHVGELPLSKFGMGAMAELGWRMLTA